MLFNKKNCCERQNSYGYNGPMINQQPMMEQPIMEPTITNCIEKEFYHEVPQACHFMIDLKNGIIST